MTRPVHQVNYVRRAAGLLLCGLPLAAVIVSAVVAVHRDSLEANKGIGWAIAALMLAGLNLYLSHVRPWLFWRRGGLPEDYRNISGFPFVGDILVIVGCLYGFGSLLTATVGAVAVLLNTGGLPWFLLCTWHDTSFWDE